MVEEEFGASYHESQVSRLLKELGKKLQMPTSGSGQDL
jgi:transposase